MILQQLLSQMKLPVPVKEHVFHPTRKWRFDYAWPEYKVALEVEGGIWMRGRGAHSRPQGIERDIEKYNAAVVLGWRVLRVVPTDLHRKITTDLLRQVLK